MDKLAAFLKSEYGITSNSIFPVRGGFSAKAAYLVAADGAEYFLKVYDKFLPTTRYFVERIERYMPVLEWLSASPTLRGRVLTPVSARDGAYKAETEQGVCVLFFYVHGETPGIQGMTLKQTAELSEILALLHDTAETIPFEASVLSEDTSLSFCAQLAQFLSNAGAERDALIDIIAPHTELLLLAIDELLLLRDTVRLGYEPLVLCHGDAHGNNVIQSERLVLTDWEDLRWAPAEADLFIYAWHPHGNALLEAYAAARRGFHINRELLYFYTLRRRVEDVWVDIQRLTEESPSLAETTKLIGYTRQGIAEIQMLCANNDPRPSTGRKTRALLRNASSAKPG